jgi:uncharacterized membrane protein
MSARRFVTALLAAGLAGTALAGGPNYTFDPTNRIPYAWTMARWPDGKVPVYTDLGSLGIVDNLRARELVVNAASQWSSVPTTSFRAAVAGDFSDVGLGDITSANITDVIGTFNGGGIYVVYDDDGSILENFFGLPPTAVLGVTSVDFVNSGTPEILEAWMVLSGPGIHLDDPNAVGFSGVVTHEFGHAINLAHSQANGAVENPSTLDEPQPRGCPAPWTGTVSPSQVETMYPFSDPVPGGTGEYMATVDRIDDMAAISDLYPARLVRTTIPKLDPSGYEPAASGLVTVAGYPDTRGIIQGDVFDSAGNPVTGVNVIARNIADPFNDFSSYITGQVSKGLNGPDGSFKLTGLTPGASYVIYVDNLLNGAFSVPRLVMLPGVEEYWNGASEGGDASTDDRCQWTPIQVAAGAPRTVAITFNHYPGAPTFIQGPDIGIPTDITPDGSIVVGGQNNSGAIFRWDIDAGDYQVLGGIMTGMASISDDGTTIAANIRDRAGILIPAIYQKGRWQALPPVDGAVACNDTQDGFSYGSAYDISGDGGTVVGLSYGRGGCYGGTIRGFKWTAAGGTVALPKFDTFDRYGRANAVNYDGSVIVGWDDASNGLRRGAQWRNGVVSLIKKGTNPVGEGLDVSRDGQYVVGAINFATNGQAWRYRPSTGIQQLGALPFQTGGVTNAISDDYEVITGYSTSLETGVLSPAIWTSALGFSDVNDFLQSQGINTDGAAIGSGTALSADGRTIVGVMLTRFGYVPWALKIPTVLICHAGQTNVVGFPQGMNAALLQGDTLGPCDGSAASAGITMSRASVTPGGTK